VIKQPISQADVSLYCIGHGMTLEQFASHVMGALVTGVPRDELGTWMRCWQIAGDMLSAEEARNLAEN
jgi:hypothetical protein